MTTTTPKMMTIRQTAATGILSEYALRLLIKQGAIPFVRVGSRTLINYNTLCRYLDDPTAFETKEGAPVNAI